MTAFVPGELIGVSDSPGVLLLAAALIGYALGALPAGYLIVRLLKGTDVRSEGSGNIGATNVLRTTGRAAGIATLLLDLAKGALAVLIGIRLGGGSDAGAIPLGGAVAYLAVVAGHVFPVTLRFRGGKGVACAIGGALVLSPLAAIAALAALLLTLAATRRVSVGSLVFALIYPVLIAAREGASWSLACAAGVSAIVILRHSSNIRRLMGGAEPQLGSR